MIATEMENIFVKKGIPVVPSLGEFTVIYLRSAFLFMIVQAITMFGVCVFTLT